MWVVIQQNTLQNTTTAFRFLYSGCLGVWGQYSLQLCITKRSILEKRSCSYVLHYIFLKNYCCGGVTGILQFTKLVPFHLNPPPPSFSHFYIILLISLPLFFFLSFPLHCLIFFYPIFPVMELWVCYILLDGKGWVANVFPRSLFMQNCSFCMWILIFYTLAVHMSEPYDAALCMMLLLSCSLPLNVENC